MDEYFVLDACGGGSDYFDQAYLRTAEGIQELQSMYDDCPFGLYPDFKNTGMEVLRANPLMGDVPAFHRLNGYIRGMYSLRLRDTLQNAIHEGKVDLRCGQNGRTRYSVSDIGIDGVYASQGLDDAKTFFASVGKDMPVIEIDVIMSANVDAWDSANGNSLISDSRKKFRLKAYMDLLNGSFVSSGDICLRGQGRRSQGLGLDDYLVPYIGLGNIEKEAERILADWDKGMLKRAKRLDIQALLNYLHMRVHFVRITKELKFRGRVFFEDAETVVYEDGREVPFSAKRGDIMIDNRIMGNPAAVIWTIIHECIHFVLHKEFFYLQRIGNSTLKYISCAVEEGTGVDKDSPLYWPEWQADRLTPRVLMPTRTAKPMAEEKLRQNAYLGPARAMEETIKYLAGFYGMSLQATKYRMEEMGFKEAKGVFNYVDRGYVPAYYGTEGLDKRATPDISEKAALELYRRDPEFRKVIDTGRFCFVENHFCLNDPAYLTKGRDGEPCLTKYAREHISDCCIIFERIPGEKLFSYTYGVLNSEITYNGPELYRPRDIPADKPMDPFEVQSERMKIYLKALEGTPFQFSAALGFHRKMRDFTQEQLAELVNISVRQVINYEKGDVKSPSKRTVVAMCVAMKLETDLSDDLLRKGGCYPGTSLDDLAILFVLHTMYEYSVQYCNGFLQKQGWEPLTKIEIVEWNKGEKKRAAS